jgi:hypothetical protein
MLCQNFDGELDLNQSIQKQNHVAYMLGPGYATPILYAGGIVLKTA